MIRKFSTSATLYIPDCAELALHRRLERDRLFKNMPTEQRKQAYILFNELWAPEGYSSGILRKKGWMFDFKPWMRRYWVKTTFGDGSYMIREIWAFDKTQIRTKSVLPHLPMEIVHVGEHK